MKNISFLKLFWVSINLTPIFLDLCKTTTSIAQYLQAFSYFFVSNHSSEDDTGSEAASQAAPFLFQHPGLCSEPPPSTPELCTGIMCAATWRSLPEWPEGALARANSLPLLRFFHWPWTWINHAIDIWWDSTSKMREMGKQHQVYEWRVKELFLKFLKGYQESAE